MSYLPHTLDDLRIMLATIGVKDIESLFSEIPEDCRLRRPLDIAGPLDEISLTAHMEMLASGTISTSQAACFLGVVHTITSCQQSWIILRLEASSIRRIRPTKPKRARETFRSILNISR